MAGFENLENEIPPSEEFWELIEEHTGGGGGGGITTDDPRLSDARTPTAHHTTHGVAGSDPVTITGAQVSDLAAIISSAIATWVGAAPGALDTLVEVANQLSTDESAVAALITTVGQKLVKASNLSDLTDAAAARANLGLGSAAVRSDTYFATSSTVNTLTATVGGKETQGAGLAYSLLFGGI